MLPAPCPSPCPSPRALHRISDQGGGISRAHEERAWQFGFTTVSQRWGPGGDTGSNGDEAPGAHSEGLGLDNQPVPSFGETWAAIESTAGMGRYRMAGLGFGLPLRWGGVGGGGGIGFGLPLR